jgi:hypothetical protein
MTTIAWHAYYFDSFKNSLPPVLTELIEAESMDDAAKIAKSHMGRCTRVDITSPVWERPQRCVLLASDGLPERPALH